MGLKTKYWGPYAWSIIHVLAKHADCRKLLELFIDTLPCAPCREWTKSELPNIVRDTCHETVIELHHRVNLKLFRQDIANDHAGAVAKWAGYELRKVQYLDLKSKRFLQSLLTYLFYVVCDLDNGRDVTIGTRFLEMVFQIQGIASQVRIPPEIKDPALNVRIAGVLKLHREMSKTTRLDPMPCQEGLEALCAEIMSA